MPESKLQKAIDNWSTIDIINSNGSVDIKVPPNELSVDNESTFQREEILHRDRKVVEYSVNEYELSVLEKSENKPFKDFAIAGFGIGIPCLLNAWTLFSANPAAVFSISSPFATNSVFGGVAFIIGVIFGIMAYQGRSERQSIIQKIKSKDPIKLLSIEGKD